MISQIETGKILFLDIETAPAQAEYSSLSETFAKLWDKKASTLRNEEELSPEELYERAGIYAEFGKIICISAGYITEGKLRVKSFYGHEEKLILENFAALLNTHFSRAGCNLCAHNGKEFDFPYISRRMLINGIKLPEILDVRGKKPWEVSFLDTMELWKFGDFKNYTSLELLAAVFGIPTPKDDIQGKDIAGVYWKDGDLERIAVYCQKDVITVARIFLKISGLKDLDENDVILL